MGAVHSSDLYSSNSERLTIKIEHVKQKNLPSSIPGLKRKKKKRNRKKKILKENNDTITETLQPTKVEDLNQETSNNKMPYLEKENVNSPSSNPTIKNEIKQETIKKESNFFFFYK